MGKLMRFLQDDSDSKEEKEILRFGVDRFKIIFISMIVLSITGILFDELFRTFLLISLMLPLRQNAGGYHIKNKWICAIVSYMIVIGCIMIFLLVKIEVAESAIIVFICTILICACAPVDNGNHILDKIEIEVYGKRARIICCLEGILFLIFIIANCSDIYITVVLSEFVTGILLVVGKLQKIVNRRIYSE